MTPKQHAAQQAVADRINDAIALHKKPTPDKRVMGALRTLVKTVAVVIIALTVLYIYR